MIKELLKWIECNFFDVKKSIGFALYEIFSLYSRSNELNWEKLHPLTLEDIKPLTLLFKSHIEQLKENGTDYNLIFTWDKEYEIPLEHLICHLERLSDETFPFLPRNKTIADWFNFQEKESNELKNLLDMTDNTDKFSKLNIKICHKIREMYHFFYTPKCANEKDSFNDMCSVILTYPRSKLLDSNKSYLKSELSMLKSLI